MKTGRPRTCNCGACQNCRSRQRMRAYLARKRGVEQKAEPPKGFIARYAWDRTQPVENWSVDQ